MPQIFFFLICLTIRMLCVCHVRCAVYRMVNWIWMGNQPCPSVPEQHSGSSEHQVALDASLERLWRKAKASRLGKSGLKTQDGSDMVKDWRSRDMTSPTPRP